MGLLGTKLTITLGHFTYAVEYNINNFILTTTTT